MYPADHIRPYIKKLINMYKTESIYNKKQIGIDAEKAFHVIKCYVCMDRKQLWDDRNDFFSRNFAANNYDLVKCNVCCDGSHITDTNQKTGFKRGKERHHSEIEEQIQYLADYYNTKIKPEEEKKKQLEMEERLIKQQKEYEAETDSVWGKGFHEELDIEMKHKSFSINIGDIADKVTKIIRAYGGDFVAVADLVKNLTIEIENTFSKTSLSKESFDVTKPDRFGNSKYIIIKVKKLELEKTKKMYFSSKKVEYNYKFEYLILSPLNKKARDECRKLIGKNVENIIDKTRKFIR